MDKIDNTSCILHYKCIILYKNNYIQKVRLIPRVGKKTAAKLLGLYHTLDGLYDNTENLKGKQKENVIENKDMAYLSKELSKIKCDMELDYDDYFLRYIEEGFNLENNRAQEFLNKLEITNL